MSEVFCPNLGRFGPKLILQEPKNDLCSEFINKAKTAKPSTANYSAVVHHSIKRNTAFESYGSAVSKMVRHDHIGTLVPSIPYWLLALIFDRVKINQYGHVAPFWKSQNHSFQTPYCAWLCDARPLRN